MYNVMVLKGEKGGGCNACYTLLNQKRIFVSAVLNGQLSQVLHQESSSLYFEFVLTNGVLLNIIFPQFLLQEFFTKI